MRKDAWITYNRRLNRLAQQRRAAMGTRQVKAGKVFKTVPSAGTVAYCSACKGPVIDDEIGRQRHGLKSAACKAAMEEKR